MHTDRTQQKRQYPSELYRIVFSSVYIKSAVALLFVAFLVQPIAPALANEEGQTPEEPQVSTDVPEEKTDTPAVEPELETTDEIVEADTEKVDDVAQKEQVQASDTDTPEDTGVGGDDSTASEEGALQEEVTSDPVKASTSKDVVSIEAEQGAVLGTSTDETTRSSSTDEVTVDSAVDDRELDGIVSSSSDTDTATSSEDRADVTADQTPQEDSQTSDGDGSDPEETPTNKADPEQTSSEPANGTTETSDAVRSATTTATSSTVVQLKSAVFNDQNKHQFSKDDCVSMGDGSFFCSKAEDLPLYTEDGVFSVPDSDGDMEIMVRVNGEESFLTDNLTDDQAPYYDGLSKRIVWQSMQNDRYQIASYDFTTKETTYLTNTSYNNMEPVAFGDLTLWQAWVVNNWEIMLFDGSTTTQLTNNAVNDIAPQVRNGYIIWQTQFADGWKIAMYDQEAKQVEYIGDADGSLAANPRLVLVYDSLDENGDVRTVGFDLDAREIVPFAQVPSQLPEKLPEPQGTEETRALIQNKSNSKDAEIVDVTGPTGTSTPKSATSTPALTDGTLDMTASTSVAQATTSEPIVDVVVPSVRDRVETIVDELLDAKLKASSTDHIEDVVIPPVATSTDETVG